MTKHIELVTPEKAAELLKNNKSNRPLSKSLIAKYANEMREGRWLANPADSIVISKSGNNANGQHRLHAIIQSGVPSYLSIVSNVDDELFYVLDTGKSRTASDIFSIAGINKPSSLSNMIKTILSIKYRIRNNVKAAGKCRQDVYTADFILKMYNENPQLYEVCYEKGHLYSKKCNNAIKDTTLGAFYFLFKEKSEEISDEYIHKLCTGIDAPNYLLGLRERLLQDRSSSVKKLTLSQKYSLIIKGWNTFRKKSNITCVRWDPKQESFPNII